MDTCVNLTDDNIVSFSKTWETETVTIHYFEDVACTKSLYDVVFTKDYCFNDTITGSGKFISYRCNEGQALGVRCDDPLCSENCVTSVLNGECSNYAKITCSSAYRLYISFALFIFVVLLNFIQ